MVNVEDGGNQTFNITPDSGYHVIDVLVDSSSVGAVTTYTFTDVTADHTILARFAKTTTSPISTPEGSQPTTVSIYDGTYIGTFYYQSRHNGLDAKNNYVFGDWKKGSLKITLTLKGVTVQQGMVIGLVSGVECDNSAFGHGGTGSFMIPSDPTINTVGSLGIPGYSVVDLTPVVVPVLK